MLRLAKNIIGLTIGLLAMQQAFAFSLLGPLETYQVPALGYSMIQFQGGIGEMGGPKNLGDEYRLNTPTLTYAFDSTFLDYFGSNGVWAVDQAMAVLNRLPAVSKASPDLSDYLTDGNQLTHHTAEALNLIDLKTVTLNMMLEHMGLMGETHVWDLHERAPISGAPSCWFSYAVVQHNYQEVAPYIWSPTPYVNGQLYTYEIQDTCPAPPNVGDAVEQLVNSSGIPFSAAATLSGTFRPGAYNLGITRDDMDGLRYLYWRKNINNEYLPPGVVIQSSAVRSPFMPVNTGTTNGAITNTLALRCGVEKITFVKTKYESWLGTYYAPLTNSYSVFIVTNGVITEQKVRRIITQPDIIFGASDLFGQTFAYRSIAFGTNAPSLFGAVGPGTIYPQTVINFSKVGQVLLNQNPYFLTEATSARYYQWASFDVRTNDPVIYPSGTSIRDLENRVLSGH